MYTFFYWIYDEHFWQQGEKKLLEITKELMLFYRGSVHIGALEKKSTCRTAQFFFAFENWHSSDCGFPKPTQIDLKHFKVKRFKIKRMIKFRVFYGARFAVNIQHLSENKLSFVTFVR